MLDFNIRKTYDGHHENPHFTDVKKKSLRVAERVHGSMALTINKNQPGIPSAKRIYLGKKKGCNPVSVARASWINKGEDIL